MTYTVRTKLERKGNGIKVENAITFFRNLENHKISSGIHSDAGAEIVKRAVHTEFGESMFYQWETPFGTVRHVPPRPAIRMTLYPEMKKEITSTYFESINNEKHKNIKNPNNNALKVLDEVGMMAQYLQQDKMIRGGYSWEGNISGNDPEHNGERTIAYKGFDDPWRQTGETISAVSYKVTKR